MRKHGAPVWTGVVIGLLLGMLLGSVWLFVRERAASAAGEGTPIILAGGTEESAGSHAVAADAASEDPILAGRRTAIVAATEKAAPSVVSINVIEHRTIRRSMAPPGMQRFFEQFFPGRYGYREFQRDVESFGSGFIVSMDGYVLTNHHVVQDADEIVVTLSDGRQFNAQVIERVPIYDLALLKIDGADLPVADLAGRSELSIGEWAIAIGSPFGYLLADTQPTVTVGVVSALNRDIKQEENRPTYLGMIQTDAAINPGNSGGPLVNADGQVVGINTFIFTESGGSIGIGFAVPIQRAIWMIEEVRQYGRFRIAYSGVFMRKLSPRLMHALEVEDPVGFMVWDVKEDSPAWKAGLRVYDIVRKINGVPLETSDTVIRLIYEGKVGTVLNFEAERNGELLTGQIVMEEWQGEVWR